jgi:hypothetical protein
MGVPGNGDSVTIQQPSAGDCFAHVVSVPTVSLVDFTLLQNPNLCTTSITGGDITVTGAFDWNGGELATPTTVASTGTISGSNGEHNTLASDLDVTGTLALTGLSGGGALTINAGTTTTIETGGSLQSSGANTITGSACCTTPAKIHNLGTISVNGGSFTISAAQLDQWATVATTSAGTLVTGGGVVTTDSAGNYTGNGSWQVQRGSNAHMIGTQTLGHTFVLDYGGLTSVSSSTLSGSPTFAGTGTLSWTGGVIEAAVTISHGTRLAVAGAHDGGARRVLSGVDLSGGGSGVPVTFTNHGTMTVTNSAAITTSSQARLVNASDGVLDFAPGTALSAAGCCTSPDRLTNSGTVAVLATAGSGVAITGTSYRSSGATAIASGHSLTITGGAPNTLTGGQVSGGGTFAIAGPTALSGTVSVAAHTRLALNAHGSLDGNGTAAGAGLFSWTGGALSGRPVFSTGGGITVSGTDTKSVANVGGGGTPSLVRFTVPTTFAAGTSHVHNAVGLGSSRLVLAARSSVGRFTEFDDGTLENDNAMSIGAWTIAMRGFTQSAAGSTSLDAVNHAHGSVSSIGAVALHGAMHVHNTVRPGAGSSIIVVKAQTLTGSLSCVTTSGTAATGTNAGHWAASQTSTQLVLHWRRGAHTHC